MTGVPPLGPRSTRRRPRRRLPKPAARSLPAVTIADAPNGDLRPVHCVVPDVQTGLKPARGLTPARPTGRGLP